MTESRGLLRGVLVAVFALFLFCGVASAQDAPATPTTTTSVQAYPASQVTCSSTPTDAVSSLAYNLSQPSSCWSCQLYRAVYTGMHALVIASYDEFVNASNGGLALAVSILSIAFVVRFLPFFTTTHGEFELIAGLRMFVFRVAAVFMLVLLVPATQNVGSGGLVSDLVIDGPLAASTEVAEMLSTAAMKGFPDLSSSMNMTSLFGTPVDAGSTTSDMLDFSQAHITAATTILWNMHQLGATGIIVSAWLLLRNPYAGDGSTGTNFVIFTASMYMIFVFFKFTFAFGLQYIDALIRTMIVFSLLPVFAFMWIFDSTRQMAVSAIRSGLALAGVFAMSGVVYSVSFFILYFGYSNAFSGQGLNFTGLTQLMCSVNSGAIASLMSQISSSGGAQTNTINWMAFFYLIGSATLATACARLPFEVSQQVFAFGGGSIGIAEGVANDLGSAVNKVVSAVRR